ncbi:ATP-dependent 6-phosphofructokinase 4, chloroplastic isoform X5 [Coffea arabica]|uniref:ATP-dependent 6-phosphofructokinase 4, chloroplastic isoform X5 n=1 Tax=Coffea arabica TaxID=13443 RepID=A0ABM4WR98_COFAR
MELSLSSSLHSTTPASFYLSTNSTSPPRQNLGLFSAAASNFSSRVLLKFNKSSILRQPRPVIVKSQSSSEITNDNDDHGFVLEDVPHLTSFLPDLPPYPNPLKYSQAYAIVKNTFVSPEDVVAQQIVVQKGSPRGIHFRRAGPREKVYFKPEQVHACIVTCGGLCPGINTVIREIVCGLHNMYGVDDVLGIQGGYRGFYSQNTIKLTPKLVNDIHKRGGTFLQTSRGGHDTKKIVDNIQDRGINQVYIIGGDGTHKGAAAISKEVEKRGLQVAVVGIPKTIDNDIADCCLIPESPFYLEGQGGLLEYVEQRLKENGHVLIVLAEGAGQEYVSQSAQAVNGTDASGNRLLLDVGLWLTQEVKDHFTNVRKMEINLKYIDPTYMIRAIPSNAYDNIYCTLLAQSAVHGTMAGYTGFTVGPVNSRHAYIPINRVTEKTNTVRLTDRMWARLLASTNQPSFLQKCEIVRERADKETMEVIDDMRITSI